MKKRTKVLEQNVLNWISKGDGQGEGKNYKPFFHVRDVPSKGRSAIDLGLKTGRSHHYLSDLEYAYHVLAEHSNSVTDIREQFALLPWEETQEISKELGISHPRYPGSSTPIVVTTDIVLTTTSVETPIVAVSVKYSNEIDLGNPKAKRTLEKLLIEKTYWNRRSIPWFLCTEKQLPINRAKNLDTFRNTMFRNEMDHLNPLLGEFATQLCEAWEPNLSMLTLLCELASNLHISKEEAFVLLGRAIWMRMLPIDLDIALIDYELPLNMTKEIYTNKGVNHD